VTVLPKGTQITFYGQNITNAHYYERVAGIGPSGMGIPTDPRHWGVEVMMPF
jgi:hypothetical protein